MPARATLTVTFAWVSSIAFASQAVPQPEISFEPNHGQAIASARFIARQPGFQLSLEAAGATIRMVGQDQAWHSVRMVFAGAGHPRFEGLGLRPGVVNYFIGRDPAAWHTAIPTYARVRARGVYSGVDVIYYASAGDLEYDLVVSPNADPGSIHLRFEGAQALRINDTGDLVLVAGGREIVEHKPTIYQDIHGVRKPVEGRYSIGTDGTVRFAVASYDRNSSLVIDPILGYATLLGGKGNDHANAVAVDSSGAAYIAGSTNSADFPTQSPAQGSSASSATLTAFVSRISPDGKTLVYSTYLGGGRAQAATAIAVDASGNAYVAGYTSSTDFPANSGFQTSYGGGSDDAFALKLDPSGTKLLYSTFLGGTGADVATGIAIDSAANAYIGGYTASANFPLKNPYQAALGATTATDEDGFVTKLDPTGATAVFSTYLGGKADDRIFGIAVDSSGAVVVAGNTNVTGFPLTPNALPSSASGNTAFLTRFAPNGQSLLFSSLLGSGGFFDGEKAYAMAMDSSGTVTVAGETSSKAFPTTPGVLQPAPGTPRIGTAGTIRPWAMKIDPVAGTRVYSTYLGIQGTPAAVACDSAGNSYVVLDISASSPQIPTKDATFLGAGTTGALLVLKPDGSDLVYGTFTNIGQSFPRAVAVDSRGSAYVAGWVDTTRGSIITSGSVQTKAGGNDDVTLIKFLQNASTAPRIDGVFNAGDYQPAPVSPGEIITIFGAGLATDPLTGLQLDGNGNVSTMLAGTRVLFDGVAVPLIYVSSTVISAIVPQGLDTTKLFTAVQVDNNGTKSQPAYVAIAKAGLAVFTADASGSGQAAALNADNTVNSTSNPVAKGSYITLYGTGAGTLNPLPADGIITSVIAKPNATVTATIGDQDATVLYAGAAPALVAGAIQITIRIPDNAPSGAAIPVVLTESGAGFTFYSNATTIAVR